MGVGIEFRKSEGLVGADCTAGLSNRSARWNSGESAKLAFAEQTEMLMAATTAKRDFDEIMERANQDGRMKTESGEEIGWSASPKRV